MPEALLLLERDGPVVTLTLNRPEALNALSRQLRQELAGAFRDLNADADVRAIVLTGAGRAFSAGVDLKEAAIAGLSLDTSSDLDFCDVMLACPWPIIAAVNGFAITGGFEIVLMCDVIYASTAAKFADTHGRVGVMPGWGMSQRLPRAIGVTRAKELSLSGNFIDAQTAERWGLVNRVFEPDTLLPAARKLAQDLASLAPDMLRKYKRLIDDGMKVTLAQGLQIEHDICRIHLSGITAEGLAAVRGDVVNRGRQQR